MGLVSDSLSNGQRFRALTLVDNFSRVSPAIEVDFWLTGRRAVEVLERVANSYGLRKIIKVDKGAELISKALDEWAYRKAVKLELSRVGKPTENAYIESFNGKLRQECLDQDWFERIEEARSKIEERREEYNQTRPHNGLGNETSKAFNENWQLNRGWSEGDILTL
jgi:putative transposase